MREIDIKDGVVRSSEELKVTEVKINGVEYVKVSSQAGRVAYVDLHGYDFELSAIWMNRKTKQKIQGFVIIDELGYDVCKYHTTEKYAIIKPEIPL